jgi:maleate isomerase
VTHPTDPTLAAWLHDDDFGWKARIGLITPSRGWTPEYEWPRLLPRGVCYFVTRMPLKATTPEELAKMGEHAIEAAELLATAEVDAIAYGCTVETVLQGIDYDRALTRELTEVTGAPAKTMTGAVLEALNAFGARKLAVVTPYIEEINQRETEFLEGLGYDVVYEKGLGIADTIELAKVPLATVHDMATAALSAAPDADALFISCGNLRTIEIIAQLEAATGKLAGVTEPIFGYGSLLERPGGAEG